MHTKHFLYHALITFFAILPVQSYADVKPYIGAEIAPVITKFKLSAYNHNGDIQQADTYTTHTVLKGFAGLFLTRQLALEASAGTGLHGQDVLNNNLEIDLLSSLMLKGVFGARAGWSFYLKGGVGYSRVTYDTLTQSEYSPAAGFGLQYRLNKFVRLSGGADTYLWGKNTGNDEYNFKTTINGLNLGINALF